MQQPRPGAGANLDYSEVKELLSREDDVALHRVTDITGNLVAAKKSFGRLTAGAFAMHDCRHLGAVMHKVCSRYRPVFRMP